MTEQDIIRAFSTTIEGDENRLPSDIQFMPPGLHTIRPTRNGEPSELTIDVNKDAADVLARSLSEIISAGQEPFLDFNHEDREASAWVRELFWAGDDPKTGGVRAKVDWTSSGKAALSGRAYRKFSPSFTVDKSGRISGTLVNAGGLVNRPAFTAISPIVAKVHDEGAEQKGNQMTEQEKALAAKDDEIKAAKADAASKDAVIAKLNETIQTQNAKLAAQAKANAIALVQAAVNEGKIPSKDDALRAKWVAALETNPDNAVLLACLPANPALKVVMTQGAPAADGNTGDSFQVKAKALADSEKITFAQAVAKIAAKEPALYEAYRKGLTEEK